MLTTKQIKEDLPKGMHTNSDLSRLFVNHGKPKQRSVVLPVDKHGNVIHNVIEAKNIHAFVPMLLNRQMANRYGKR